MKRFLGGIILVVLALTFTPALPVAAQSSNICKPNSVCTKDQVGVFMMGITSTCGNSGECELSDIMIVISNIGNWVLGVIGGVVFLIYIYGGVMLIGIPGWDTAERKNKAKKMLSGATIGLLIVMFSYVGIFTLRSVMISGSLSIGSTEGGKNTNYVICDSKTEGEICDLNSTCHSGICTSQCLQDHKNKPSEEQWDCVDTTGNNFSECETGKCPGEKNVKCCVTLTPTK